MIRKIFVCILTILLITSSINIGGITPFSSKKVEAKKEINIPKTIEKVSELEELREPNTKTFVNSDGTYTKEIYTEDIHFEENGQLENISNTPEVNNEEDKGDFKYKNKDNRFSVKFAKDTKKKNLYKLKMDGETIQVQIVNPKSTAAKSSKGIITYENILENVDFKYSIGNSSVKEDIILTKKDSARKFQFNIKTSLEPKKENGAINFYNKENQVAWVMIPPFMEDANGKYSEDITMDLEKSKNGYLITIIPDSTFLDEKDTEYPVRIDPSVNIGGTSANTLDSYVMSKYSTNNYYNTPELRTGYTTSTGTTRTYMDFAQYLPDLTGKLLVRAELKVHKMNDIGTVSPTNLYANRITSPWDSTKVTWNTQPGIDGSVSYGSTSATGSARWLSMDLTGLVNGWLKGHYPEYGVVLRSTSEGSAGSYQKYYSSESASGKPYLAITYSDPPGGLNSVPYSYKDGTGYVDLSWAPVEGATGYKVQIFNGAGYEAFNVGNTTWWSTRGKKLWPTRSQIDSGQYGLRHGGDGRELPENPNYLYVKNSGVYKDSTNYWFRVTAYNTYGETDIWGNGVVPYIPDQTKPTAPTAVQVTNDRFNSYTIGWQPGTDLDGSGIAKYRVYLGDQPGVANLVNGQETTNQYFTYSGALTPRKTYYAWVQAIDNSSNVSDNSVPAEKMARKEFDAQIESYSIPVETDIDNAAAGENLWFDVRNTGTTSWTNDLNINLSITSTAPDGTAPTGFVGYLNTGEVIKPNEVKRFYVNWKPKTALIGSYRLKAVVGKGTDPTYINPTENIVDRTINVKDIKAPTGKVAINENAPYATDKNVSVKAFDVYDNAIGDMSVQFANGPENAEASALQFSESMPVTQSTPAYNWALKDQDGKQFVYAKFSDKSGNVSGLFSDSIILDRTLPEIKLTNVADGDYLSGTKKISGSITDQDLATYRLEYRNKNDQTAVWNLIAEKNAAVTDGTIAEWDTSSLPKGEYELRISATDRAGQTNLVTKSIWIDKLEKQWLGSESYYPTYPLSLLDGAGFVNLYNGSLNMQAVDFSLPARGFSLAIGRSYASNREQKGLLGKGWISNLEEQLVIGSNTVEYNDPDGTIHRFDKLPDGKFTAPAGTSYVLTFSDGKGYELLERNGNLVTKGFNLNGKLVKIADTNSNSIQYLYENNRLTKIESLNKSISLSYNADNTIERAAFSTGEKVSYTYSDGYLTDAKLLTKSGKVSSTTHYDYEAGKVKAVVSENGLKVEFAYNGNRLVQTKTKRSTRVVDGSKTYPVKTYESIVDKLSYNLTANKIYATTNSINSDQTSKNLANTEYELNGEGNLWKQNIIRTYVENENPDNANQDQNNILVTTDYEQNRVKSTTDGLGNKTSFEYDSFGNVLKKTLPAVTSNGVKSTH